MDLPTHPPLLMGSGRKSGHKRDKKGPGLASLCQTISLILTAEQTINVDAYSDTGTRHSPVISLNSFKMMGKTGFVHYSQKWVFNIMDRLEITQEKASPSSGLMK